MRLLRIILRRNIRRFVLLVFSCVFALLIACGFIQLFFSSYYFEPPSDECSRKMTNIRIYDQFTRLPSVVSWWWQSIWLNRLIIASPILSAALQSPKLKIEKFGLDERYLRTGGHNGHNIDTSLLKKKEGDCVVYSFGINYDFSLDDEIASRFGCAVLSFDPSMMLQGNYTRTSGVQFYTFGLLNFDDDDFVLPRPQLPDSHDTKKWQMRSLDSLMQYFGHSHIDLLKMDIESSEWPVLDYITRASSFTNQIGQLNVEIHINPRWHIYGLNDFFSIWRDFISCTPFEVIDIDHWAGYSWLSLDNYYLVTLINPLFYST